MNVYHYQERSKQALIDFLQEKNLMNCPSLFVLITGSSMSGTKHLEHVVLSSLPQIQSSEIFYNLGGPVSSEAELTFFAFEFDGDATNLANRNSVYQFLTTILNKNLALKSIYETMKSESSALFQYNPNLVISLDGHGNVINLNQETERQLGYGKSDLCHRSAIHLIKMGDRERAKSYFRKASHGTTATTTLDICDRGGRHHPFEITLIPIFIEEDLKGYFAVGINKSAQREAENKLEHIAYHDTLTGLANRFLFEQSLNYMIKHAQSTSKKLAVLFLDLDRFKLINDTSGHFVGDRILQQAVHRIKSELSPDQLLARFEGDKFSIIMPHIEDESSVEALASQIREAFEPPFIFEESEFFLSISIGVSLFPQDGFNDEQLMKNADIALFSAKSKANSSVAYYTTKMDSEFSDRVEFESYLRKALKKGEFLLYYQPQVSIESGKLSGCEALIRWKHPKLGLISPVHFIPLAEEIGLIEEIGFWVLETACQQIKLWQEKGLQPFPISINVSFRQFLKSDFVAQVKAIIKKNNIDPKWIHLEITESTTVQDLQYSISLVKELKRIGVSVSLDDFGTGYSALSVLKDFTLDILKIDRSFIRNLGKVQEDRAIVKAIIMMCKGLRLKTIAEGVETQEQLELLKQFGCEMAQGFYYSKPVPSENFETNFLKAASS